MEIMHLIFFPSVCIDQLLYWVYVSSETKPERLLHSILLFIYRKSYSHRDIQQGYHMFSLYRAALIQTFARFQN